MEQSIYKVFSKALDSNFVQLFKFKRGSYAQYRFILLDKVKEIATCAVFKDNPEVIASLVPIVKLQDIGVAQIVENADLDN
jgi:hypothetical protein